MTSPRPAKRQKLDSGRKRQLTSLHKYVKNKKFEFPESDELHEAKITKTDVDTARLINDQLAEIARNYDNYATNIEQEFALRKRFQDIRRFAKAVVKTRVGVNQVLNLLENVELYSYSDKCDDDGGFSFTMLLRQTRPKQCTTLGNAICDALSFGPDVIKNMVSFIASDRIMLDWDGDHFNLCKSYQEHIGVLNSAHDFTNLKGLLGYDAIPLIPFAQIINHLVCVPCKTVADMMIDSMLTGIPGWRFPTKFVKL